jgi:phosphoribosylformylglycinamidine synthase
VLGICNGFQILCEAGLLPGVLMRNTSLKFVCRTVTLEVAATDTPFTGRYTVGQKLSVPVAHGEGNWQGDGATVAALTDENRIIFRYADDRTVNGSLGEIAGICSANRRVLGLMPHPENAVDPLTGSTDGAALFQAAVEAA